MLLKIVLTTQDSSADKFYMKDVNNMSTVTRPKYNINIVTMMPMV